MYCIRIAVDGHVDFINSRACGSAASVSGLGEWISFHSSHGMVIMAEI